ncbi:MAG: GNAT family N-acetyltransferase [Mycobacteriales bacterium]
MTPALVDWLPGQLAARADDVLDVYADAMQVSRAAARSRRSVLASHLDRDGLTAVAALEGDRLIGIAYGYQGAPGQWWHDHVRAAMGPRLAQEWLRDAFEVCELHVRPTFQQQGLGRDLLVRLLSHTRALTAVLTTPDQNTRARQFYRDGGWVDLVRDLHFPGDPRSFAVLGLAL